MTFAQAWLAQVGEHRSAKRKSAGWIPEQRLVIEPASPCFGIFDIQLKTVLRHSTYTHVLESLLNINEPYKKSLFYNVVIGTERKVIYTFH